MYKKKNIEKKYLVIIILIFLAFLLSFFSFIIVDNRKLTFIEQGIKDTVLSINKVFVVAGNKIKNKITEVKTRKNLYEKYRIIKQKYEKVELMSAKYDEAQKEINELNKILKLNKSLSQNSYLNAMVVTRNIGYWYNTITIDKGKNNGVEKNMAVITNRGLIGNVASVSNFNSTIKLLTNEDMNSKLSVKIKINNKKFVYGLLTKYNKKNKLFSIEGIAENTNIPIDSVVTTTGLGNSFPSGILIGKVKNITKDNFDLASTVEVESSVNFDDISYVTLLKKDKNDKVN